ncbi:MAG TPA: hypothetical protein VHA55_12670 [Pseudorhodoplanes sp.]|nr:hypothetical protein [Pseudorhodoplanes sp.]
MTQMPRILLTSARCRRSWPAVAALLGAVLVGGCAGTVGDSIPADLGGLPADAPARPTTPLAYPAVHDMPPPRPVRMLDEEQQEKLQKDLIRARERQESHRPTPKKPSDAGADQKP